LVAELDRISKVKVSRNRGLNLKIQRCGNYKSSL
jgi:hypothetical protein